MRFIQSTLIVCFISVILIGISFTRVDHFNHDLNDDKELQSAFLNQKKIIPHKYAHYHQPSADVSKLNLEPSTEALQRGNSLYLSQACYSCHNNFPASKKALADLEISHIPRYELNTIDLQDLMTFLTNQTSESRQRDWQKTIAPEKILDIRNSMIIYATEGCASCHRLRGFDSSVEFAIQKNEEKPSFDAVYREREWFRHLFPDQISGSTIVETIDLHAKEIDQHIVSQSEHKGILEEIELRFPGTIATFYENFTYASNAKEAFFKEKIRSEVSPEMKKMLLLESLEWKERIHRILMIYIQEYGLGRLLGPSLDWAGIYRTDQWLMSYFHQPSSELFEAQMPAFPFDDSKFYALTFMLDALAKKNNEADQETWLHRGFNPEQAYQLYCAQCHGNNLQGDGPVAKWIDAIPKNLGDPILMRNLTREISTVAILGIKGSVMGPWGAVTPEKGNTTPVLNKEQTKLLVEWIFEKLPGENQIKGFKELEKWIYSPQDVIRELHQEKHELEENPQKQTGIQKEGEEYKIYFDVKPPTIGRPTFTIKRKYYTLHNLEAGRLFYKDNCVVCHGLNGDGNGIRAKVLEAAKPRAFTNGPWLSTQDDLSLLRSIKYGKPGTSMAAWGDDTNSLQRIQLVLYIRSLGLTKRLKEKLNDAIYQFFGNEEELVTIERSKDAIRLAKLEDVPKQQSLDQLYIKLLDLLHQERKLYLQLGEDLIDESPNEEDFDSFLKVAFSKKPSLQLANGQMIMRPGKALQEENDAIKKNILQLDIDRLQRSQTAENISRMEKKIDSIFSTLTVLEQQLKQIVDEINKSQAQQ